MEQKKHINGSLNWSFDFLFGFNLGTVWDIIRRKIAEKKDQTLTDVWLNMSIKDHTFEKVGKYEYAYVLTLFVSPKGDKNTINKVIEIVRNEIVFIGTKVDIKCVDNNNYERWEIYDNEKWEED